MLNILSVFGRAMVFPVITANVRVEPPHRTAWQITWEYEQTLRITCDDY